MQALTQPESGGEHPGVAVARSKWRRTPKHIFCHRAALGNRNFPAIAGICQDAIRLYSFTLGRFLSPPAPMDLCGRRRGQ